MKVANKVLLKKNTSLDEKQKIRYFENQRGVLTILQEKQKPESKI